MTEDKFRSYWYGGLAAGALIVAVVAGLVLALIATARSILANAERALAVADEIVTHTRPIWQLETTNTVAYGLLAGAEALEEHATQLADALDVPEPAAES